uniref:Uncharacterized protein n=1 Tax=Zea mays TaxID=4577 RepID=A0A804Q7N9_MAIZE
MYNRCRGALARHDDLTDRERKLWAWGSRTKELRAELGRTREGVGTGNRRQGDSQLGAQQRAEGDERAMGSSAAGRSSQAPWEKTRAETARARPRLLQISMKQDLGAATEKVRAGRDTRKLQSQRGAARPNPSKEEAPALDGATEGRV